MTKTYQAHFELRGSAYDRAMRKFPDARQAEFHQLIEAAELESGMVVADVPAGGGYLQGYLPAGCQWLAHEPCASFTNHGQPSEQVVPLLPLPWSDGCIDVALSLAGIHHIDDKRPLFREFYRVVRSGGRLVVSDVASASAVAHFLDGYVGANNSTGHEGVFLDEWTLSEITQAGWTIERVETSHFHWVFANRVDMAAFCHELFDLRASTEADTLQTVECTLGVDDLQAGGVGMRWSLMTIVAQRS